MDRETLDIIESNIRKIISENNDTPSIAFYLGAYLVKARKECNNIENNREKMNYIHKIIALNEILDDIKVLFKRCIYNNYTFQRLIDIEDMIEEIFEEHKRNYAIKSAALGDNKEESDDRE